MRARRLQELVCSTFILNVFTYLCASKKCWVLESSVMVIILYVCILQVLRPQKCAKSFTSFCDMDSDRRVSRQEWRSCVGLDENSKLQIIEVLYCIVRTLRSFPVVCERMEVMFCSTR